MASTKNTRSTHRQPTKRGIVLLVAFMGLGVVSLLGEQTQNQLFASAANDGSMPTSGYAATPLPSDKGALGGDADLGQIIVDKPHQDGDDNDNIKDADQPGQGPGPKIKLPFTADQARLKENMADKFKAGSITTEVDSISPVGGLVTGETRVLVRGGLMSSAGIRTSFKNMNLIFPQPRCKFGRNDQIVKAQYVGCTESPLEFQQLEGKHLHRDHMCLMCDNSPANADGSEIVPFSISLTGDFTDTEDSEPYRYYTVPKVYSIKPRYGPKDGQTHVEVWGEGFLNYQQYTTCNFGTKSVKAEFFNSGYMKCRAPESDVVAKKIPFSVSLNGQQNTRDDVDYYYYNAPTVSELVPNFGPDSGGNKVRIKGSNFNPFVELVNPDGGMQIDNRNDTFCLFAEIGAMPLVVEKSTLAYCEAPPNLNGLDYTFVEVSLNAQNYTDDNIEYFYYKPPKIYDVTPREGPTRGGTEVIVTGAEFLTDKKIICQYGSIKTRGKLMSTSQVKCLSPKIDTPGPVPLLITYEGDGAKFGSEAAEFLYYETPIIDSIEPPCGPTYGYTQIKVKGKHFIDMGFDKVKCIFNQTTFMNATIVDEEHLECSTPKLTELQSSLPPEFMFYHVDVTLNGHETSESNIRFEYYPDPVINQVEDAALGPITGNTNSVLSGVGFKHRNVCNLKVRYGALEVQPHEVHNDTSIETKSPVVNLPDQVTLSPSGNGQQYSADYILHYRDIENTYTYYQDVFVHMLHPQYGPTSGKTKIEVQGIGFKQFKHEDDQKDKLNKKMYYKFTDKDSGTQIGDIHSVKALSNDNFFLNSPASPDGTKAIISVSYNKQDWQPIIPEGKGHSFQFFNAPQCKSISPHFGPVKSSEPIKAVVSGVNFICPNQDCSHLTVRFGSQDKKDFVYVPGKRLDDQRVEVEVPRYTKPDVLHVEVSVNGEDYTNDKVTYGFFDPFIVNIGPRLISPDGTTELKMNGFGFVNSEPDQIKVKYVGKDGRELLCNGKACVKQARYVDKNTLMAPTFPVSQMTYKDSGEPVDADEVHPEVSVYGDHFTDNKIPVHYFKHPEYKSINRSSSPSNLIQPLLIDTDFHWDNNDLGLVEKHQNFTCRFTIGEKVFYQSAKMDKLPLGSKYDSLDGDKAENRPTHLLCPSPKTKGFNGLGKLDISINGQDFHGGFPFEFTKPLELHRITPTAGPRQGGSKIKMIGSGFQSAKNAVFGKFGIIGTEMIHKDQVVDLAWSQESYLNSLLMTSSDLTKFKQKNSELKDGDELDTVFVSAAQIPDKEHSMGGPVYISVGQHIDVQGKDNVKSDATKQVKTAGHATSVNQLGAGNGRRLSNDKERYTYSNSLVEYYYYKTPVVKKVDPTSGSSNGGTPIEISGAWFDQKLEYGLIPMCKIGDKVVRATFVSTVRIVCEAPPNADINQAFKVKVSLNGVNWVDTGKKFNYFDMAEIDRMTPQSGPMSGGTEIYLHGEKFSNITEHGKALCKFSQVLEGKANPDHVVFPKVIPAYYLNETTVMCASPNGFAGGDQSYVQLTQNGKDYTSQSPGIVFSFYNVQGSFPRSGPADSFDEVILIRGSGFKGSASNTVCQLNSTIVPALEVTPEQIKCPMATSNKDPSATGYVKLSVKIEGSWVEFSDFFYYDQIVLDDMTPRNGPAEGRGIIYFYGSGFRDDYRGVELGCKVGDAIGQGTLIDSGTIKCIIDEMDLVNEGDDLPASVALNSYSWPKRVTPLTFIPYGITGVSPSSGPYAGYTEILVSGKGFTSEIAENAKCRFGIESNSVVVDAEVLDYTKLMCKSPPDFKLPTGADEFLSVPFGIAFNKEEFQPWTEGTNRFRFYTQPRISQANPDEVTIGKMAEIFVSADEGTKFFEPVPSGGGSSQNQYGIQCNFQEFGNTVGMYINETTLLCVSPRIPGDPEDYSTEKVKLSVAMNGQDFNEIESEAFVTFIGNGSNLGIFKFLLTAILLSLLFVALGYAGIALWTYLKASQIDIPIPIYQQPKPASLGPNTIMLRGGVEQGVRGNVAGENVLLSGDAFRPSTGQGRSPPPRLTGSQF